MRADLPRDRNDDDGEKGKLMPGGLEIGIFGVFGIASVVFIVMGAWLALMIQDRNLYRDKMFKAEKHAATAIEFMGDLVAMVGDVVGELVRSREKDNDR